MKTFKDHHSEGVNMYAYLFYNYSTLPLLLELSVKCQCFLKLCCTICLFISAPSFTTKEKHWSIEFLSPVIYLSRSTKMTFLLYNYVYVRPHILVWKLFLMLGFNKYIKTKLSLVVQLWCFVSRVCFSDLVI